MSAATLVSAGAWLLLALFHSILGEKLVLRPLLGETNWKLQRLPRASAEKLLRFAWHITSISWLSFAGIALGLPISWCLMAVALVAGTCLLISLRRHLAWPVFFVAGLASAWSVGLLQAVVRPLAVLTSVAFVALGVLHIYWAGTGGRGSSGALPSRSDGELAFRPGPGITLLVAMCLLAFAAILASSLLYTNPALRVLVGIGALVLFGRAIGDGRYIGFTKRIRDTRFGQLDDRFYTPIAVLLALGSVGALLV